MEIRKKSKATKKVQNAREMPMESAFDKKRTRLLLSEWRKTEGNTLIFKRAKQGVKTRRRKKEIRLREKTQARGISPHVKGS